MGSDEGMSYLMVMRINVSPDDFDRVAQENADSMREISERSKDVGAIHHAFYAGDGEMLVVDEWDSPDSFQKFFEAEQPNIGPLMQAAGVQGEPQITFYRKSDSLDAF
jgi:heme-degrading monooxygenase HmoA